ncbi:MAG: 2Fe-2S iron-sulfur cluster binding domain-containing protein, partial [Chloroflexi bacterium]|nr:2Fe-2S iron-sulfur cluster binding domain-containing protein [Chloroflexota bacterium]
MSPLVHGDRELELTRGRSLFDYADDLSVRVPTSCRRDGECHECIVEVRQGLDAPPPPTEAE